jgi:hypothetical protein
MRKLFLPGILGLSTILLTALATARACVANGSPPRPDQIAGTASGLKKPKIVFRSDGKDIVASIQVTANGSPHALWTTYEFGTGNVVTLRYGLLQNSDRLVRCLKTVTIEWRLKNFAILPGPPLTYRVEGSSMTLKSQELKALIPQLQVLVADRADRSGPTGA